MDQSDDMVSSKLESTLSETAKKAKPSPRIPKCTRCQNHGKEVEVKYHKKECEYRYCLCKLCILTTKRQLIMKEQTAQRRERQQYEILMEMKKKKAEKKAVEATARVNGSSDINSSDKPTLSNYTSNSKPCMRIVDPVVKIPMPQNLPPMLPHPTSPTTTFFEPESNSKEVEVLLGYSAKLLELFGYPLQSLSLMYVILKESKSDVEVAMQRITKANSEIQAMAQYKASRFGGPYYYPGYTGSLGTLGNPTYFGQVPYVGMASPPTAAGLRLFPYSLGTHVGTTEVPSSPDNSAERPSPYLESSMNYSFKIEKSEDMN